MSIVADQAPDWAHRVARHRAALRATLDRAFALEGPRWSELEPVFAAILGPTATDQILIRIAGALEQETEATYLGVLDQIISEYEAGLREAYGRLWGVSDEIYRG